MILIDYQEEVAILTSIPGISNNTASVIIAEIRVDMSQFPSSERLPSWAGLSPGDHESAGKRKSTRATKGNPHIKSAFMRSCLGCLKE